MLNIRSVGIVISSIGVEGSDCVGGGGGGRCGRRTGRSVSVSSVLVDGSFVDILD
jgi:hypothetical protein